MTDVQAEHCCSVTLIVVGADLDPDEVTKALGLEAHKSWRRGERKAWVRPDGSIQRFDSVHERGGWKHFLPPRYKENRPLHEQFHRWLARLRGLAEAIKTLTARGWEVELDCFATGSEALVLTNGDLRELAELGVGLALTLSRGVERADA
jgi:hypothetical protein